LPVNSAICKPADGSTVKLEDGYLKAQGYAWSGGGRKIVRVDVTADGGKTWFVADLKQDSSPLYRCWAWDIMERKFDSKSKILLLLLFCHSKFVLKLCHDKVKGVVNFFFFQK